MSEGGDLVENTKGNPGFKIGNGVNVDEVPKLLAASNNIVSGEHPNLKELGISGKSLDSILPQYIYRFRTGGQFG